MIHRVPTLSILNPLAQGSFVLGFFETRSEIIATANSAAVLETSAGGIIGGGRAAVPGPIVGAGLPVWSQHVVLLSLWGGGEGGEASWSGAIVPSGGSVAAAALAELWAWSFQLSGRADVACGSWLCENENWFRPNAERTTNFCDFLLW
jgi:hypothetical protein